MKINFTERQKILLCIALGDLKNKATNSNSAYEIQELVNLFASDIQLGKFIEASREFPSR